MSEKEKIEIHNLAKLLYRIEESEHVPSIISDYEGPIFAGSMEDAEIISRLKGKE